MQQSYKNMYKIYKYIPLRKIGQKKIEIPNNIPQTKVLNPVLAPDLIPAADSGDINIGGPVTTNNESNY